MSLAVLSVPTADSQKTQVNAAPFLAVRRKGRKCPFRDSQMVRRVRAMKKSLAFLTALFLVWSCFPAHPEEPRKFEFRMEPGESATYALHVDTTTQYVEYKSRGTERRTFVFKSDMQVLLRCIEVTADGLVRVEITYPEFFMETAMTEGGRTSKIVTDSQGVKTYLDGKLGDQATWELVEKEGRPNLKKVFGSIIRFTLDRKGRVLDAKAPEGLRVQLAGVDIKQFFRNQVIFPGVPIVPGAEWSESSEREAPPGPGPLSGKIMLDETSYEYQRNETAMGRETARIHVVVKSRPRDEIPNLKEFKQTSEGWSLIALENSQLVQSEMKLYQEVKGTPGGIRTELKTTGKVTTSLLPTSPAKADSAQEKAPAGKK